jgi:hypothetical protein
MDRALKFAAIGLLGAFGVVYVAAKIHFFTRFDGDFGAYFAGHWPYWAGMAMIGILLFALGTLAERLARSAASERAVQQRVSAADEVRAGHGSRGPRS